MQAGVLGHWGFRQGFDLLCAGRKALGEVPDCQECHSQPAGLALQGAGQSLRDAWHCYSQTMCFGLHFLICKMVLIVLTVIASSQGG
jgi:hypothetical protein